MKRATIARAAWLYSKSIVAHLDAGGCSTDAEWDVVRAAADKARAELERKGYDAADLGSLQACIAAAIRETEK